MSLNEAAVCGILGFAISGRLTRTDRSGASRPGIRTSAPFHHGRIAGRGSHLDSDCRSGEPERLERTMRIRRVVVHPYEPFAAESEWRLRLLQPPASGLVTFSYSPRIRHFSIAFVNDLRVAGTDPSKPSIEE